MTNRPTQKLELPSGVGHVLIREWISGREQEYTEEPLLKATSLGGTRKNNADDITLDISPEKAIHENNHREIEVFIECIVIGELVVEQKDGKEKIRDAVLDNLPSTDYEAILNAIKEIREKAKKK